MNTNIQWYVASGKTAIGPLSFEDLKFQVVDGALTPSTKVWCKDLGPWVHANKVPEVAALIEQVLVEKRSKPRWMMVVDKKVKRETEGPFSDSDIEAKLVDGLRLDKAIFWTKGQEGWLALEKVKDLVECKARAEAIKGAHPPVIDDGSEIPEIPHEDEPPAIHDDDSEVSAATIALDVAAPLAPMSGLPASQVFAQNPTADLAKGLDDVFATSRWLPKVQIFMKELDKGIDTGDAIKIDGAVEQIRLFLLREVQPDHSSRHPAMTEANLKLVSDLLQALVLDPIVKAKVQKFDPFFTRSPDGAPSITATRTRSLLGAVAVKSFYPNETSR